MNRVRNLIIALLVAAPMSLMASVDQNPLSNGQTTGRNIVGGGPEATFANPALLGCERPPRGGLLLAPITNYGLGYWSDKLALSPFTILGNLPTSQENTRNLIRQVLWNSFDLSSGMTADQISEKLTEKLNGGVSIYAGARANILSFAHGRFALDVTTHFDEEVRIPEGPLYLIFSGDDGLRRGKTLDLSNFKQEGVWATDVTLNLGLPVSIPALHNLFKLRYGAGGIGLKYVMGHSMLRATTKAGSAITYSEASNALNTHAEITVQSAGTGLHGAWKMENMFDKGAINGHGIGVEIGGLLYDDNAAMSINVQNLGVLFWTNNTKRVIYKIDKDTLDAFTLIKAMDLGGGGDSILGRLADRNKGEYLPDSRDTLKTDNVDPTLLPLELNIGYARTWDFTQGKYKNMKILADHANAALNYQQQLTNGPGRSFIPRLSLGGEVGFLNNFIPLRMGFILGGPEHYGSALGMGFNFRYFSIHGAYKAVGHMLFWPSRGFEASAGLNINWGMSVDTDRDGIVDKNDKCPKIPEDVDGFEDKDGCPDYDNDNDAIPDTLDKCVNVPEDKDGFEDADGCPEFDNDDDGIPDSTDKCPDVREDKDNFQDQDGCPEFDNDGDNIADTVDKCPNLPEDIDGFEDADGCPEYDNDKDGIPDSTDKCIDVPEMFNGYKDDDGCPDTLMKPTESEQKTLNTKLRAINFKTASAELTSDSYSALNFIVGFLKQYPYLRYEIQGHTDSQGNEEYNLLLSAARAGSVRNYLLTQGIADSNIIGIGYGKTRPIADNKTAAGRAQNRRVEFKIIETKDEFNNLKIQEGNFRERIRAAKIKGAEY